MGRQKEKFLLFVAVLCKVTMASLDADLVVLPLGLNKVFVCASPPEPGYGLVWLVNGTSAASSQLPYIALGEEVQSGDGGVQRNITFTADIRANNTHLRCIVTSFEGDSNISVNLNLILQGRVPAPAVAYEMSSDHHSVMFSWSAPFTLNISDMKPDILYYVVYITRDDGRNETVNTTDTHYELQADPCQSHQYHVEIAAVNVVGEGEKYKSPELILEGYAVAVVSDTAVSSRNKMVAIEIIVEVSSHCDEDEVVNYEVELNATYSDDKLLFYSSGSAVKHTLSLTSPTISMNELYDCSVRIEGVPNSESVRMNLSTFDVQNVSTTVHDQHSGCIDITCYFAEESDASGCRITAETLQEYDNATFEFVALKQEDDKATVTVALPNGEYTLLVYDYEAGTVDNPAFTATLSVQGLAQVTECAMVLNDSASETTVILIVILSLSGIVTAVIASFIIFVSTWFCKRKGKKYVQPDTEQNDYCDHRSVQLQHIGSLSSESSRSSENSSGSDSLDQSIGSNSISPLVPWPVSGHTHYADLDVARECSMTRPPPPSNDEPVEYVTLQHQDATAHSHQSQGTMNGQPSGPHATDDSN